MDNNNEPKDQEREPMGRLADMAKKVVTAGMGAAVMSEESVRKLLNDVPKDVVQSVLEGAQKTKKKLAQSVAQELAKKIDTLDVQKEVSKLLQEHKFRITIDVTKKSSEKPDEGS